MATAAGTSIDKSLSGKPDPRKGVVGTIDRWIYVFMAVLFLVTVLVGFIPDSIAKLAAIQAGKRPPFPPILHVHAALILHVHAALMGCWLLLLLTQTTLMATGHRALHRKLGVIGMVLAPAIVVAGFLLVPTMYGMTWSALQAAPSGSEAEVELRRMLGAKTNIALVQIRIGILFAVFVTLGLLARRRDAGIHKRLMILATAIPIPAATDRMLWLPSTLPANPLTVDLYPLLLIAPMFFWDLYRTRHVHRAYLIWLGVSLPFVVALHLLWGSAWWAATVPGLMGVPA